MDIIFIHVILTNFTNSWTTTKIPFLPPCFQRLSNLRAINISLLIILVQTLDFTLCTFPSASTTNLAYLNFIIHTFKNTLFFSYSLCNFLLVPSTQIHKSTLDKGFKEGFRFGVRLPLKRLYLLVHFEKKMMELEILGSLQRCHAQSLNETN